MMRIVLTLACLSLLACTKDVEPGQGSEPAKTEASNDIVLSEASQKQSGVAVTRVEIRTLPTLVLATGRITNDENRTWRVGAVTEGRIERILANPGDAVDAGEVLARMHSHDIHESRALYQKAKTELNRAHTAAEYSRRTRDRTRRLFDLKATSLEQVEHSEAALRFAESEVANAEVELERTKRHLVDFLQIAPEEPAPGSAQSHTHDEDLIPIPAPAAGIVIARNISRGAVVSPAADLFLISDLSSVWMIAEVHADQLPKLAVGQPVRLRVSAFPSRDFPARIGKIGDTLNPDSRTLQVRVEAANPSRLLKPEMYATAEIQAGHSGTGVFLPSEAIQEVRGISTVFVEKSNGRFEGRAVTTGRNVNGDVEIVRGLQAGERVVTAGSFILKSELLKASLAEEE